MKMDKDTERMQYAGAIGLLCECSVQVDDETRECIKEAVEDWCEITGWRVSQTLHRIEVLPPTIGG